MAFFSKVGGIVRQTASRQINADSSASRPSIFQAIRCMSSSKLFIGGLSYSTDEQSLREAFSKYGYVAEARVIVDRETGRSRGFGFVTYSSAEEASSAIQALDGQDLHGRRVRVNYATDRARGGGFGGGGGGGYGGGYGGNYGAPGGSYGANNSGYGGGNYGGGGNYNSSYDGGNASYGGSGNYPAGNTGGDGGSSGNYGVAGGGGGADSGFDGNTGFGGNTGGFGGGSDGFNVAAGGTSPDGVANQFGGDESSSIGGEAGGFDQDGPLEGNYRDDDDDADNFAKRA